eukprot:scaffold38947_cov52-Prasinocladus_malaysianus.AAC.2
MDVTSSHAETLRSFMCTYQGPGAGVLRQAEHAFFAGTTLVCSLVDWPMRWMSRFMLCTHTTRVRAAPAANDSKTSSELWELSSRIVGVSATPST